MNMSMDIETCTDKDSDMDTDTEMETNTKKCHRMDNLKIYNNKSFDVYETWGDGGQNMFKGSALYIEYTHLRAIRMTCRLSFSFLFPILCRSSRYMVFFTFFPQCYPSLHLLYSRRRCLDVTSTHTSSTGDYDPNGMTSECNDPKTF
jgi:hypothetical protein